MSKILTTIGHKCDVCGKEQIVGKDTIDECEEEWARLNWKVVSIKVLEIKNDSSRELEICSDCFKAFKDVHSRINRNGG